MKIKEFIVVPKNLEDTTSCGTTSSASKGQPTQDIVCLLYTSDAADE